MTTEEKAKAYDKAIERAKSKLHYPDKPCFVDVTEIFPELAEREDELNENLIEWLIGYLEYQIMNATITEEKDNCLDAISMLKSLKDRVQPKQEWSEEDKKMHDFALRAIGLCKQYAINNQINGYSKLPDTPQKYEELYHWLKPLKGTTTWKPSDEHYELEEFAKIVRCNLTGISKAVQELFKAKYLQLTGRKMYGGFKD